LLEKLIGLLRVISEGVRFGLPQLIEGVGDVFESTTQKPGFVRMGPSAGRMGPGA
jgi:hypothetical protein